MKRFFAILLLFAIAAQSFWNLGVAGYWLANRDFIAKNLCVNRDRPAACCEGKCYLEKNLIDDAGRAAAEKQSEFEKIELKKGIELAEPPVDGRFFLNPKSLAQRSASFAPARFWASLLREKGIFRPPIGDLAAPQKA